MPRPSAEPGTNVGGWRLRRESESKIRVGVEQKSGCSQVGNVTAAGRGWAVLPTPLGVEERCTDVGMRVDVGV